MNRVGAGVWMDEPRRFAVRSDRRERRQRDFSLRGLRSK